MNDDTDREQLAEAYRATTYVGMPDDAPEWRVRVDEPSPVAGPMAYITSDNPGSEPLDDETNALRRADLKATLRAADLEITPAKSIADNGDWPTEYGFWVHDIDRNDAVEIAARYGQNAILFVDEHGNAELVFCPPAGNGGPGPTGPGRAPGIPPWQT